MPRGRSTGCFCLPSNTNSSVSYNTAYTNIGQLLAEHKIKRSHEIIGSSSRAAAMIKGVSSSTGHYINVEKMLERYPWYHGKTDRQKAENLVLGQQVDTVNGTFLVRKSSTRVGQHVVTFNNSGQATHIQFILDYKGHCKVKSQWFDTIFDMLEHFRSHPIPVESARNTDATLAGYVSNLVTIHTICG